MIWSDEQRKDDVDGLEKPDQSQSEAWKLFSLI